MNQMYDKRIERDTFIGLNSNMQTSLKENGFVCRNEKSDQYYVIYKHNTGYDEGFLNESDIKDFLDLNKSYIGKNKIYEFYGRNNIDEHNFQNLPFANKLYMLLSSFGSEEIMGKPTQSLTFEEAMDIVENE